MATQKNALPVPPAETPEEHPQAGGSYTRNPDGTLTKNAGPDLAPAPAEAATTDPQE